MMESGIGECEMEKQGGGCLIQKEIGEDWLGVSHE